MSEDYYTNCEAFNQQALERDNEINKITPDPVLPCYGGPGPVNPPNALAATIANVVPGHEGLGDRATHRRLLVVHRAR